MTEPTEEPMPDPASVSTEDELRAAVLALLGDSYDRAVERRTGLSKTTVNDVRNDRRKLTAKTLTLIVEAYDPQRRDAWLAAWRRVRTRSERPGLPTAGDRYGHAAENGHLPDGSALDAGNGAASSPTAPGPDGTALAPAHDTGRDRDALDGPGTRGRERAGRWRSVALMVGVALAASAAAALITYLAAGGGGTDPAASATTGTGGAGLAPPLPGQLPALGPGGPGAAGPVGGMGPPRLDVSPAAQGAPPVARGCYSLPLQTRADVVAQPGATAAGISLTELRYTYYHAWHPSLAVGGRLSGPLPRTSRLVFAAWADPASKDSTVAHNRGNGRFYPGDELAPTDQNCFTVPPYSLGYGGYAGITTRLYAMLVEASEVTPFLHAAGQSAGLTDTDLARFDIRILGYAVVPSSAE